MALLVLLFIIVPIAELAVIIQVGQALGVLQTLGLLILVSVVGAFMVKAEGLRLLFSARRKLTRGELPSDELVNGVLVMLGGALMLTPGFITDAIGLSMLIPPVRAVVKRVVMRRYKDRITTFEAGGRGPGRGNIYDTDIADD